MAFLDFLGQGVGGMEQAQGPNLPAQGPGITGEPGAFSGAGVGSPRPIGPTWGDVARTAIQYGSSPGSSGPALAGSTLPNSGWSQRQMTPLDPNAPKQQKALMGQDTSNDDTLGMIAKWFMSILGVGA